MTDVATDVRPDDPLALAEQALLVVLSDPVRGELLASAAVETARRTDHPAAASLAHRALGIAARDRDDLGTAELHLRRALRIAGRHQLRASGGQALAALASVQFLKGQAAAALDTAERAGGILTGNDLAVLRSHQGTMLLWMGRPAEALDRFGAALRVFRRNADLPHQAVVYGNRGLLRLHSGALAAAVRDLHRSELLYRELGNRHWAAYVGEHLGMASARRGDLVQALAWFGNAETALLELGATDPLATMDRIEALLSARLLVEARAAAEVVVDQLVQHQRYLHVGRARLLLAEVALQQGDLEAALAAAREARRSLSRQGQRGHVILCDYLVLRANWPRTAATASRLARTIRIADDLATARLEPHATDARLRRPYGPGAGAAGRRDRAAGEVPGRPAARSGRAPLPGLAGHGAAAAVGRRPAGGRDGGTDRALRRRAVPDHPRRHRSACARLPARHRARRAGTGARTGRRPAGGILAWSERWRARALHLRPRRVSADPILTEQLDRLRRLNRDMDHLLITGGDTRPLAQEQLALEHAVQQRARSPPWPRRPRRPG